jgi:hypothetical protein
MYEDKKLEEVHELLNNQELITEEHLVEQAGITKSILFHWLKNRRIQPHRIKRVCPFCQRIFIGLSCDCQRQSGRGPFMQTLHKERFYTPKYPLYPKLK